MTRRKTGLHWVLILIVVLYAVALLVAPIFAIIQGAFENGIQPVLNALTAPDVLSALRLSLIIGALATLINTVLGIIIAWVLVRHHFPGKRFFDSLVDLPFVVSPVIVGYVLIVMFGRQGWFKDLPLQVAFSTTGILLVTVFVSLPFVIREVMPVLAAMTPEQEEAAYTLGASRWTIFWRIVFPGLRHALVYGVVLTFARALGEFGAAAVAGGGVQGVTETATLYIYRATHDRNDAGAYSVALLLGVTAMIILTLMNRLRRAD
jgi:sulfate/thiosulfate transport system permease protein